LGFSPSGGGGSRPAHILERSTSTQSPDELRFSLSHFRPGRANQKPTGRKSAPMLCCVDVRFVNAIQSLAMVAAASRRTINITTGLASGAAAAPIAGRPSPSSRYFPSLTHTTASRLDVSPCGGALRTTAPGKKRHPRSRILIVCLIRPRCGAGRAAWTLYNRLDPFSAKRSPALRVG